MVSEQRSFSLLSRPTGPRQFVCHASSSACEMLAPVRAVLRLLQSLRRRTLCALHPWRRSLAIWGQNCATAQSRTTTNFSTRVSSTLTKWWRVRSQVSAIHDLMNGMHSGSQELLHSLDPISLLHRPLCSRLSIYNLNAVKDSTQAPRILLGTRTPVQPIGLADSLCGVAWWAKVSTTGAKSVNPKRQCRHHS